MYSLMSMRTIAPRVEQELGQRLASSVLPTPVGPRNRNEPIGRLGSLRPARARRTASATRDRLVLPDHALVQPLLHPQQLLRSLSSSR
jgi:hypothetical protein